MIDVFTEAFCMINRDKTELYYFGPNPGTADILSQIIECKPGNLPFKYLGLPLHNKRLRREDWAFVINRIESRIDGWKAKLLSQGRRLTLHSGSYTE
ncbi:hypothetical protein ACMD2_10166 [Ananas comosus]|uniref:Uncharacterized protein n=1 Tax=Ananas comosus TaxID=4615 RepID=A0A199W5V2_ANACO|nr:hypothetical protein ACMD2_10166 [Ananas comosus]